MREEIKRCKINIMENIIAENDKPITVGKIKKEARDIK